MIKTKQELITQNNALIKTNGNEEITGAILNGHLKDIIDSYKIDDGITITTVYLFSQESNPTINGTNTGITINKLPLQQIEVAVNGITSKIGTNVNSEFYIMNSTSDIIRTSLNDIQVGDFLHYNSTTLEYVIDNTDLITLTYLSV